MPGLVGFSGGRDWHNCSDILEKMQQAITHRSFYINDELFVKNTVWATQSRSLVQQIPPGPVRANSCYLWFHGELYNRQDCPITPDGRFADGQITTDAQWLLTAYENYRQSDQPWKFLHPLDAQFYAVLYDERSRQLHLINDRLGLRPLHWTIWENTLVWVSEIKALLALPGYQPTLDKETVEDFLGIRYPLKDNSWFKGVERLPAATVLTWDEDRATTKTHRYWSWDSVSVYEKLPDRREIVEEFGRLFSSAVERRCLPGERLGIPLSGGLDSRSLLAAAVGKASSPPTTITYGQANCDDLLIAPQVAKMAGAEHHWIEMNSQNWLLPRIPYLWEMDSPASIIHMQFSSLLDWVSKHQSFDILFHGDCAGRFDGRQFFPPEDFDKYLCRQLNLDGFARSPKHHQSVRERARAYFESLDSSCYKLGLNSRSRSFISKDWRMGTVEGINVRLPWMDNQLQEYWYALYSTGEDLGGLYYLMLLNSFPKLFKELPWQKIGKPISEVVVPLGWQGDLINLQRKIRSKVERKLNLNKPASKSNNSSENSNILREFTDYNGWLRQEPARSLITRLLKAPDALYPEYCNRDVTLQDWENHLNGKDSFDRIGTVFTLELWLQQLFNNRYRNGIDEPMKAQMY